MALIMGVWVGRRLRLAPAAPQYPRFELRGWVLLGYLFTFGFLAWALATALRTPSKETSYGRGPSIALGAFHLRLVPRVRREAELALSCGG